MLPQLRSLHHTLAKAQVHYLIQLTDPHNSVASNRDPIASSPMRTGENFRGICVQATVVDVQTEVNGAVEPENLRGGPDSREGEEEDH